MTGIDGPHPSIPALWGAYLASLPPEARDPSWTWVADQFGDTREHGDTLAELVLAGRKRATAPCVPELELAGEAIPEVGDHLVVLDGSGEARCIVRTTRVTVVPFDEVTAAFAAREGEGDGSLAWWRTEHLAYYERVLSPYGVKPTAKLPVICEEFELVYTP